MDMNRYSDRDPRSVAKSTPDHWVLFLIEGVALILLGLLAVAVPSIVSENVTGILGWLFLLSGATGLVNMIFGGCALFTTGVHARVEWAIANEVPLRNA